MTSWSFLHHPTKSRMKFCCLSQLSSWLRCSLSGSYHSLRENKIFALSLIYMTLWLHEGMGGGWAESVLILNASVPRESHEIPVAVATQVSELAALCTFSQNPPWLLTWIREARPVRLHLSVQHKNTPKWPKTILSVWINKINLVCFSCDLFL